jgi:hypothetical protein
LNAYARSLPTLGFDPAPGDVGLTRNLAQQHSLVAQEARQVLALVERLNLSPLQGRTADALRTIQATFPPALRSTASAAETLQAAASSWANQLSGFQAEADALERQAAAATAHHQAVQAQQATMPPGSAVLTADVQTASATVTAIHAQAQELHQRYLAAASKTSAGLDGASSDGSGGDKGKENPFTVILEKFHSALDAAGIDGVLWALGKNAALAEKFMKELPAQEQDWLLEMMRADVAAKAANPEADLSELASQTTSRWFSKADAAEGFGEQFAQDSRVLGLVSRAGRLVGGPVALLGDVLTVIHPSQTGATGTADRAVAGVNGIVVGADTAGAIGEALGVDALASLSLGPVGVGIAVGTGLYLAGTYAYQHFAWFRDDFANPVGHAVAGAAKDVSHAAVDGAKDVYHYGVVDVAHFFGL